MGDIKYRLSLESTKVTLQHQHNSLLQSKSYVYATYNCNHYLSSKELLFAADGHHNRESEPDTMQRSTDHREPRHNGSIYITVPEFTLREHQGRGAERLREPEFQEICCETVSLRNSCITKTRTRVLSVKTLTWRKKMSTSRQRPIANQ